MMRIARLPDGTRATCDRRWFKRDQDISNLDAEMTTCGRKAVIVITTEGEKWGFEYACKRHARSILKRLDRVMKFVVKVSE